MTMLQINNLYATVADKLILKGLSLSINAGGIHTLMGALGMEPRLSDGISLKGSVV